MSLVDGIYMLAAGYGLSELLLIQFGQQAWILGAIIIMTLALVGSAYQIGKN